MTVPPLGPWNGRPMMISPMLDPPVPAGMTQTLRGASYVDPGAQTPGRLPVSFCFVGSQTGPFGPTLLSATTMSASGVPLPRTTLTCSARTVSEPSVPVIFSLILMSTSAPSGASAVVSAPSRPSSGTGAPSTVRFATWLVPAMTGVIEPAAHEPVALDVAAWTPSSAGEPAGI